MITTVDPPIPAEYLPSGDHALLIGWRAYGQVLTSVSETLTRALLILEDGSVKEAALTEFKIDYRYDHESSEWLDASVPVGQSFGDEEKDADADQEDADDGSASVQGQVPEPD